MKNKVTVPMVVLVNGSTSDGAELFANALRKMNSATIVGTRTAGKGVVMSDAQSFSDGSAAYITIGLLLDNEGQSWNDLGLTPDVDAALSSDEQNAYYDYTRRHRPPDQQGPQRRHGAGRPELIFPNFPALRGRPPCPP